jgi:hypothetical protein
MKKDPYALWRSLFILEKQERPAAVCPCCFLVRRFRVYSQRFRPYRLHSAEVSEFGSSEIFLGGSDFEI